MVRTVPPARRTTTVARTWLAWKRIRGRSRRDAVSPGATVAASRVVTLAGAHLQRAQCGPGEQQHGADADDQGGRGQSDPFGEGAHVSGGGRCAVAVGRVGGRAGLGPSGITYEANGEVDQDAG